MTDNSFTYENAKHLPIRDSKEALEVAFCIRALAVQLSDFVNNLQVDNAEQRALATTIAKQFDVVWTAAREATNRLDDLRGLQGDFDKQKGA